jgi:hypothetical protein
MAKSKTSGDNNTKAASPPPQEKQVVPLQLGLLQDMQGSTLQDRFEMWGREAVDALTTTRKDGEPIFPAGKAKAEMLIKVTIERNADDALMFSISNETKQKMPKVPGVSRSSIYTVDSGLIQKVTPDQFPLFNPLDGQPKAMTAEEAAKELGDDE